MASTSAAESSLACEGRRVERRVALGLQETTLGNEQKTEVSVAVINRCRASRLRKMRGVIPRPSILEKEPNGAKVS